MSCQLGKHHRQVGVTQVSAPGCHQLAKFLRPLLGWQDFPLRIVIRVVGVRLALIKQDAFQSAHLSCQLDAMPAGAV